MANFTAADRVGAVGGYIGGISALGNIVSGAANVLSGMAGNAVAGTCQATACSDNQAVNRYEATMMQVMAAKDGEIAILKSEKYTDEKLVEVYKDLNSQIAGVKAIIQANKDEQYQVNLQQATYNGVNTATLNCMQQQINQLLGITKVVVPNTSVCPGWGNVTITPATTTTTTSPAA